MQAPEIQMVMMIFLIRNGREDYVWSATLPSPSLCSWLLNMKIQIHFKVLLAKMKILCAGSRNPVSLVLVFGEAGVSSPIADTKRGNGLRLYGPIQRPALIWGLVCAWASSTAPAHKHSLSWPKTRRARAPLPSPPRGKNPPPPTQKKKKFKFIWKKRV